MNERTSITEYSKEELKQLHFELWDWLVNNPDKEKYEWLKWKELPKDVGNYCSCFACVSVNNVEGNGYNNYYCKGCPLKVPTHLLTNKLPKDYICAFKEDSDTSSVFDEWHHSTVIAETIECAKIIRDSWK